MQAILSIPDLETLRKYEGGPAFLSREVLGIPLLVRVIATAMRAGVDSVVMLWPDDVDVAIREKCLESPELRGLKVTTIERFLMFDPRDECAWKTLAGCLQDEFLWLPWNWVTNKNGLATLPRSGPAVVKWHVPALIQKESVLSHYRVRAHAGWGLNGVSVTSTGQARKAERFLVAHSGKATDGIYSKANRFLCRWPVRLVAHTPVTPNMVTLMGLVVAIAAAIFYSRGSYLTSVAGGALFFISGLLDDMDGMLARIKFRESAFGTWFEGFVDNATYLLLFGGITVGLSHQRGVRDLMWGIALITGCILSVIVIALQRKRATAADRPHEYSARMNSLFDRDASLASKAARHLNVFVRKGVVVHYIFLFTILGLLPLFIRLAAIGANLTWTLGLYFTSKYFSTKQVQTVAKNVPSAA